MEIPWLVYAGGDLGVVGEEARESEAGRRESSWEKGLGRKKFEKGRKGVKVDGVGWGKRGRAEKKLLATRGGGRQMETLVMNLTGSMVWADPPDRDGIAPTKAPPPTSPASTFPSTTTSQA